MRYIAEQETLLAAVSRAEQAAVTAAATMYGPNLLLGTIRMELSEDSEICCTGSDGKTVSIQAFADVKGMKPGTVFVPAKLMSQSVKALPEGEVTVSEDGGKLRLTGEGHNKFDIQLADAEGVKAQGSLTRESGEEAIFPVLEAPDTDPIVVQAEDLWDGLKQVAAAASGDEARPILTGINFENHKEGAALAATDSYRLHTKDLSDSGVLTEIGTSGTSALLPATAVAKLLKLVSDQEGGAAAAVSCRFGQNAASFELDEGQVTLVAGMIEGDFPNWRNLFPAEDPPCRIVCGKEELTAAVKRAQIMAVDAAPVRLSSYAGRLLVSAGNAGGGPGSAEASLSADISGGLAEIAFNHRYLLDALSSSEGEYATISVYAPAKPAVVTDDEDPAFKALLMPVRIT